MMMVGTNTSVFLQTIMFVMNQSNIQQESSYNYYYMQIGKQSNATKCYGIYGCFALSPPWTSEHRPVSLFPEDLSKIEPSYPFYTRDNPSTPKYINLNDFDVIGSAGINPLHPVYLISHGYMEGGGIYWIKDMARELLKIHDCTVIVVDWHGGSSPPYTQAVANIRLVGAMTAHLLYDLSKYTGNLKLDHVHGIGHSLGAHLTGYIGYTLQSQFNLTLGRITGLDPAEPHFAKAQPPVRLDRTAANYVDIVHTDASQFIRGGLGITERIGHVDYYPNGGTNQPGCGKSVVQYISDNNGSVFQGVKKYLGCNHVRSYEFYIESINPKCQKFISISCKSYEDFNSGKCFGCGARGERCLTFGYHGQKHYNDLVEKRYINPDWNLVQYFKTADRKPYCQSHFKVDVSISDSDQSKTHGGEIGQIFFTFHATSNGNGPKTIPVPLNSGGYHEPGKTYTAVISTSEILNLEAVEVEWKYQSSLFNPLTWRLLAIPKIHIKRIVIEGLELKKRMIVCPKEVDAFVNSKPLFLIPSYC